MASSVSGIVLLVPLSVSHEPLVGPIRLLPSNSYSLIRYKNCLGPDPPLSEIVTVIEAEVSVTSLNKETVFPFESVGFVQKVL